MALSRTSRCPPKQPEPLRLELDSILNLSFKTGVVAGDRVIVHSSYRDRSGVVGSSLSDADLLRLAKWLDEAIAFKELQQVTPG